MDSASTAGPNKNVEKHQASPTSVVALSIDVNSALDHQNNSLDQPSLSSPGDSKSRRSRRRRKAKARGNQVEPVGVSSPSPRSRNNYNKKKKNGSNNSFNNNNNNNNNNNSVSQNNDGGGQQQRSSSFRTPIVTWRGSRGPRNNKSRYDNGSNNHNRQNKKNWNHPSPRMNKNTGSPVCPASTGYPTSKKQHDAPMKKRDLYFSLHVERVAIASHQSTSGSANEQAKETRAETQHQEQKAVARVTLTNWENEFVLDTFVAIPVPVTNFYDTGIRPEDVQSRGSSSPKSSVTDEISVASGTTDDTVSCFASVRAKVERILRGKILIGHNLNEALHALGLSHPVTDTRDCSVYFAKTGTDTNARTYQSSPSLASFLEEWSQKELSRPFHSAKAKIARDSPNNGGVMVLKKDSPISRRPMQICVTTMDLYKKRRKEWETELIAQARERDLQQQNYLLKISQQRQQEQQQAQQQQAQQQQAQQHQHRDSVAPISLHCETVRTALSGRTKTLARVTILDGLSRNLLLDEFAQIPVPVTDFCDTGITAMDVMANGCNGDPSSSNSTKPLSVLRSHVERLLRGRLLIGYKIEESLKALGLTHPWVHVRDTAYFPAFLHNKVVGGSTSVVTVRSLDELSEEFLHKQLRPLGDRSRPVDLCHGALGLYETFRDQWERQHRESFINRQQQQQVQRQHHQNRPGRIVPPSPTSILQSPHHSNQYYGQQSPSSMYGAQGGMMLSPSHQQQQRQVLMPEQQQQQHPDTQSRSNTSSSWFPWAKQQQQQQNIVVGASQMLSPQAFQLLQEDSGAQISFPPSPSNSFYRDNSSISSHHGGSTYVEGSSPYDGSTRGMDSELNSEAFATESVVSSVLSSLPDEASSVMSSDRASSAICSPPPISKGDDSSSLPSSWFRFGTKKDKYPGPDDVKHNCETMVAVQETEVLTDDGMLPSPTQLFSPSQNFEYEESKSSQKTKSTEEKDPSLSFSMSPATSSRNWFGFRRSASNSPTPKDQSESGQSSFSESTYEDLSIGAQPEVVAKAATEASIEITLSMPNSAEPTGVTSPLVEKPSTTSLSCRPSSSWFGFRRSSKFAAPKNDNLNSNSSGKVSVESEMSCHPDLPPAPTERTAAMDEEWMQEFMNQSASASQGLEPWMSGAEENAEKPSSTSRGQASWFGFKRSKATGSNKTSRLDSAMGALKSDGQYEDDAWRDSGAAGAYWLEGGANGSIHENFEHSNNDDVFHARDRLLTESTIPSITTDEPSVGEGSDSEGCSKDFDFGAAQSFNFLKI